MQKLVMEHEGTLHTHSLKENTFRNVAVYGILSKPWRGGSGSGNNGDGIDKAKGPLPDVPIT